jgi:hypothetical protein
MLVKPSQGADAGRRKLQAVIELFKKYGSQYNIDYVLQERRAGAKAELANRK